MLACTTPGGAGAYPLPEGTLRLIAEAPTLEPAVALRRFVENALAPATVTERPELVERIMTHRLAAPQDPAGWAAQAAAGMSFDRFADSGSIAASTLVQHGTEDRVVDVRNAAMLGERIPRGDRGAVRGRRPPLLLGAARALRLVGDRIPGERLMGSDLTLGRWLADRARNTPGRVAIDFLGASLTYGELDARARRVAAGLAARGLRRGDRLATLTGSSPEHVAVLFACARLGVALQPLSWRLSAVELAYQLDDADPSLLLVAPEHDALADAIGSSVPREELTWDSLEADGEVDDVAEDGDALLLVYTSGTTGKPKGAVLSHANCFWTNLCFDLTTNLRDTDVVLQVLPQFHVGGWNVQPLLAWWKGATVVLEPVFDAGRALRLIEERGVTTMMGVPATYLFMAQDPHFERADLSSLRLAVVGGAPMPEPLLETWRDRGVAIVQGYGLTEAAPNVLCLPPEDATRKLGFAGRPYPHVDVALRDPDSGNAPRGSRHRRARRQGAERLRRLLAQSRGDRRRVRGRLAAHR